MKARTSKRTKDGTFLISVAESIGSTLGAIAAKANAAQRVLTESSVAHTAKHKSKKFARQSKGAARKTRGAAANLKKSRLARATRRGLHRVTSRAKRAVSRGIAKANGARQG